ncbi:MAG: TusE/DsrC/DsvC family sulfur relay protein [Deltaproteobacteria bacterium]|nr:TusE/DsrC/DsvC family sulfur relay protein [Deltaproteobacteria bacterium]
MPSFDFNGKTIETDDEGYLQNLDNWNKEIAEYLAKSEGITLTEKHWKLIEWLRDYFAKFQVAPAIKSLIKEVGKLENIEDKKEANKFLYELFPEGPAKQLAKISGLPKPTGCV